MPQMAERGGGSVIIVSSIGGLRGSTDASASTASPRPPTSRCAAPSPVEWGPKNVRINCIAPGLVKTDFARALWEDTELTGAPQSDSPLRRIGEPDEIAGAVAFLGSDAATFMTGQTIVIDGGVTTAAV